MECVCVCVLPVFLRAGKTADRPAIERGLQARQGPPFPAALQTGEKASEEGAEGIIPAKPGPGPFFFFWFVRERGRSVTK